MANATGRPTAPLSRTIDDEPLPDRRTTDFEEVVVTVSRTGGFTLRKVF
ncbi:hypothetical protein SAMN05216228_107416 [Rhizobium tibeticum]|uniref:Uncharacterized protein n=1 Tax=Rhizobium tibeticum TaxID=501024 RepID=A0A1H8WQV7_9HYPH|nr:hypothetical protein RTCCBAU85039_6665 [Rhizobium tibeticum]SEP30031.1 hypothetical protein SAMN05216228_107416 [Rhizobium tibeticum]